MGILSTRGGGPQNSNYQKGYNNQGGNRNSGPRGHGGSWGASREAYALNPDMNEAAHDQGSSVQNGPKVEALETKLNDLVLALTGQNQCSTTHEAYVCTVAETLTSSIDCCSTMDESAFTVDLTGAGMVIEEHPFEPALLLSPLASPPVPHYSSAVDQSSASD